MTITTNIMNTDHVKELLHKAAGLDKETGSTRNKQIMHRLLTDIYTMIEDLDITPEEFWQGVNYNPSPLSTHSLYSVSPVDNLFSPPSYLSHE